MLKIPTFFGALCTFFLILVGGASTITANNVTLSNPNLTVQVQDGLVTFSRNEQVFASFMLPSDAQTTHETGTFRTFSSSQGAEMIIALADALPFATITIKPIKTEEKRTISSLCIPEIRLSPSFKPEEFKALGSAGLTAVDGHKGSYMFLAIAHPNTRNGVVAAWVTSQKGSGVVFSSVTENAEITIQPELQYGRCVVPAQSDTDSTVALTPDTFIIGVFDDCLDGLEMYADYVAKCHNIQMKPQISGYCTWYSNKNSNAGTEETTREFADVAAEKLVPFGMNFFQIDDYWQMGKRINGPAKNFMEHNPEGPYQSGMKPTAEYLNSRGLTAGVWFMPFSGNWNDPYYADKQEWFVKSAIDYPPPGEKNMRRYSGINQKKGAPYETFWGGTSLDMTDKEVERYVHTEVDQIANKWGYKYFKYDGMWTAMACEQLYVNDEFMPDDLGLQIFDNPNLTNVEVYRKGLNMVREAGGDDVFILGCNVSQNMRTMGASYGLVDAMRIGPDNGPSWQGVCAGPIRGTARYFYNGRVWYNDPDPVYVRDSIPLSRAQLSTSWAAISGQLYAFSDWLPELSDERVNVLQRTIAPSRLYTARPLDLFESELAHIWKVIAPKGSKKPIDAAIFGVFNWDENIPLVIEKTAQQLELDAEATYVGYDFWNDTFIPPFKGSFTCEIPGGACRILAVTKMKDGIPTLVSTNRHVTSPLFEVENVTWNAEKMILSGVSAVVANDPYELRLVLPEGMKVQQSQNAMQVIEQLGRTLRVRFVPEKSGNVDWSIHFELGAAPIPAPSMPSNLTAKANFSGVQIQWDTTPHFGFLMTRKTMDENSPENVVTRVLNVTDYLDRTTELGKTYIYTIQTRGWDGTFSSPASVEAKMPAEIVVPEVPPLPDVNIVELKAVKMTNGWGSVHTNQAVSGNPLKLAGKTYQKGIGVHAHSELVYDIPPRMTRFVATVGLDDMHVDDARRSVLVRVWTDVCEMGEPAVLLAESPLLSNNTVPVWYFDLPLDDRAKQIRLEVTDAEDGIACDHVDWVNTGFLRKR